MTALVDTVLSFVRQRESWAIPIAFLVAFGEIALLPVDRVAG